MDLLFEIQNLKCAYKGGSTVLEIEKLEIPRGELVFILGVSGIGKSTFLETLGLMNHTMYHAEDKSVLFYPKSDESHELKNIWTKSDKYRASFRNEHFSFLFQSTNLMPNFSAGENMCITQMIQGQSRDKAAKKVKEVMKVLDLPEEIFDRRITELSGGQRQRLAFVRAITPEFSVLFGDEPTGNLDKFTAAKLMHFLKETLSQNNRTGIVVSHDIPLSLEFADRIVLLSPKPVEEGNIGVVKQEHIFQKNKGQWQSQSGEIIQNPEQVIFHILLGKSTTVENYS